MLPEATMTTEGVKGGTSTNSTGSTFHAVTVLGKDILYHWREHDTGTILLELVPGRSGDKDQVLVRAHGHRVFYSHRFTSFA
jgi:hypothetical protein